MHALNGYNDEVLHCYIKCIYNVVYPYLIE